MSKDILQQIQTEKINTSEEFLDRLYDRTVEWLEEGGGKVIQEFGPQKVENWDRFDDFHKGASVMSINLLRACVVEDSRKVFLLTLGRGRRGQHGYTDSLRFQFGFFPSLRIEAKHVNEKLDIKERKPLLYQGKVGQHGSGEIFAGLNSEKIGVDCWANSSLYGGEEINNWPPEQILTGQGLEEALNIIKKTVQRAFNEDLT
jgi:hypothetical protein